jgi:hypothetical protein
VLNSGQLCVLHNLLDDGTVNLLRFHAGEAILERIMLKEVVKSFYVHSLKRIH